MMVRVHTLSGFVPRPQVAVVGPGDADELALSLLAQTPQRTVEDNPSWAR